MQDGPMDTKAPWVILVAQKWVDHLKKMDNSSPIQRYDKALMHSLDELAKHRSDKDWSSFHEERESSARAFKELGLRNVGHSLYSVTAMQRRMSNEMIINKMIDTLIENFTKSHASLVTLEVRVQTLRFLFELNEFESGNVEYLEQQVQSFHREDPSADYAALRDHHFSQKLRWIMNNA